MTKATARNKGFNSNPTFPFLDRLFGNSLETGHPLFHALRSPFTGRTASLLLLFRMKATTGLLRNFALRNDDPARSEAAGGRSQQWRNKGALQAFFPSFSKTRVFCSKLFQIKLWSVLWDFKGLQGFQTSFDGFQIFRLKPPSFGRILPEFTMQFSRRRFHRGAATQIERILNLTDNPVFGKNYP